MDFNSGKISGRSGLGAVGLLRGSPVAEDAAAGVVKAFAAKFGHFGSACLAWSRLSRWVSCKDPPLPAIPGGGGSGQDYRGRRAEPACSLPTVQAQTERLTLTLSLTLNCFQMMMV